MEDTTAFTNARKKELVVMGEQFFQKKKKLQREVDEKGLKLTVTEGRKEGKSKAIKYLEERFQECKKEGVVLVTGVETL